MNERQSEMDKETPIDQQNVTFITDLNEGNKIGAMPPVEVKETLFELRLPSAKIIPSIKWEDPETLNTLIGLAKQERAIRTERLVRYPANKRECDKIVEALWNAPYSAYKDSLPLPDLKRYLWQEQKAWAALDKRITEALASWIEFAEHYFIDQKRLYLTHEHGAYALIEGIDERGRVSWKGTKIQLEFYLNISTLWNHVPVTKRVTYARDVFLINGKPATLSAGNISAAEGTAGHKAQGIVRKHLKEIDHSIRWHGVFPRKVKRF